MSTKLPDSGETDVNWGSGEVAQNWSRGQAQREEFYQPATEMMLDLADLRTGNRVLDVAAGTGDQTLLAARRVGLNGHVLATDLSATMLKAAIEAARKAGLTNVETRTMNAEDLDLNPGSFDVVICRLGLMLFSDPPKALRGMHRVVKPGGKVATLVFSTAEKNPYQGVPSAILQGLGSKVPSLFALGEPGMLEDAFRKGGFPSVAVHTVSLQRRFPSSAEYVRSLQDTPFAPIMAKLPDAERQQAGAEIEQRISQLKGSNGLELSGEVLIGVGTK